MSTAQSPSPAAPAPVSKGVPEWAVKAAEELLKTDGVLTTYLCADKGNGAAKQLAAIIARHAPVAEAAQPHENTCGCFGCVEGRREIEGQRKRIRELEADAAQRVAPVPAVSDPVKGEPYILRQMRQRLNDSSLQCISTEERQDIIDFITTAKAAAVNAERERDELHKLIDEVTTACPWPDTMGWQDASPEDVALFKRVKEYFATRKLRPPAVAVEHGRLVEALKSARDYAKLYRLLTDQDVAAMDEAIAALTSSVTPPETHSEAGKE